jgi:hypothetical protein
MDAVSRQQPTQRIAPNASARAPLGAAPRGSSPSDRFQPAAGSAQPGVYSRAQLNQCVRPGQPAAGSQQQRPYDPNQDANDLYQAMKGGFTGWGTDEAKIWKTLEGKTPEQIAALRANYKDHFGRDLDADLQSELAGAELTRARALMSGDNAKAEAAALRYAMEGMGTDEAAVYKALEGKSPEQRKAIAEAYRQETGRELRADLKADLAGSELTRAESLLDGNNAKADAATLHYAMTGLGTDEEAVYKALEGKSKEERAAILAEYQKTYNVDLRERLRGDFSGAELDRATALLDGDKAGADAATIKHAMHGGFLGLGTDEEAINKALEGKSPEERRAILAAYGKQYKADLRTDLRGDMAGNDLERAETLLERGKISDAQALKFATEGWGTDEDAIKQTLKGKSKAEIRQISQEFYQRTGRHLAPELLSELSGRDQFDAYQALQGKPQSAEEALQRMNERRDYERSNGFSNLVTDTFNESGERLDRNTARANEQYGRYQQALREGRTEDARAEKARLDELIGYSTSDVDHYRETKDEAAEWAATLVTAPVGMGVGLGVKGLAWGARALVTATAVGSARAGAVSLIQGQGYAREDMLRDLTIGGLEGASGPLGRQAATALVRGVSSQSLREGAELIATQQMLQTRGVVVASELTDEVDKILIAQRQRLHTVAHHGVEQGGSNAAGPALGEKTWTGDEPAAVDYRLAQMQRGGSYPEFYADNAEGLML